MFNVECNCLSQALTCGRARCSHKPVRQPALKMLPQPVPPPLSSSHVCAALSRVPIVTPWTVARQAPPSMGFFRQGYWSGLPFPPPGDLPDPGQKPASPLSPALQANSWPTEPPGRPLSSWHACRVGVTGPCLRVAVLFIGARSSLLFPENVVSGGGSPCPLRQLSTLRLRTWEREACRV